MVIKLGRRRTSGLHEFTYNDFVRGYSGALSERAPGKGRFVCRVHPMHKGWIILWPQPEIWRGINLSNGAPVKAFGCRIEFDPGIPKGEAHFSL